MPQEGGGLGRARTARSSDEASVCTEETVATEERFCFVLVELYTCHSLSDTTKSVKFSLCRLGCQSINHLYGSKFIAASSIFNAMYVSSVI